jgi:uncharacterized SAM-binding protein YcdF (DUF218 family)
MEDNTPKSSIVSLRRSLAHALKVAAALAFILVAGFVLFAFHVTRLSPPQGYDADAIVALTGGEDRIAEAVRLLSEGRAKRLLISGVNRYTTKPELINVNAVGVGARLFRCCIDLDKRAANTEDNATETTAWMRRRGFKSLIVVTSNYHMPRSLIELRQSMPDVELIPYPVQSNTLQRVWWSNGRSLRVLMKEYMKFVTAAARYAANTMMASRQSEAPGRLVNARLG